MFFFSVALFCLMVVGGLGIRTGPSTSRNDASVSGSPTSSLFSDYRNFLKATKPLFPQDDLNAAWNFADTSATTDIGCELARAKISLHYLISLARNVNSEILFKSYEFRKKFDELYFSRLKECCLDYLKELFPDRSISFKNKTKGVQLGVIVVLRAEGFHDRHIYVKSHEHGPQLVSASSGRSRYRTSEATDTHKGLEAFMYCLLYEFGVGMVPHFFGKNSKEFYIGTEGAEDSGLFIPGTKMNELTHDEQLSLEIVYIDLLARLFCLSDLNEGNFGLLVNGSNMQGVILDFRIENIGDFGRNAMDMWENAEHSFTSSVVISVLKKSVQDRTILAQRIVRERLQDYTARVNRAAELFASKMHEATPVKWPSRVKENIKSFIDRLGH